MAQASINIQPVKEGSEQHNKREKYLDYVHPERTHLNEYWEKDTQTNRLAKIKAKYFETTGQKLQKRATPIREGCVNVEEWTTSADLEELAKRFHDRFGIYTFQFAIHKDEGYPNSKNGNKLNLHAHMVFDWTDPETGKTIKLNRQQMAEMQTITAEVLGMQRGVSSDKKHLTAMQYKEQKAREEAEKAIKAKAQAEQMAAAQTKAIALQSLLGGLAIHAAKVEQKRIENITNTLAEAGKKRLDEIAELKQEKEKTAVEVEKTRSTLLFERGRVDYRQKQLEGLRSEISRLEGKKSEALDIIARKEQAEKDIQSLKSMERDMNMQLDVITGEVVKQEGWRDSLKEEVLKLTQEKQREEKSLSEFKETVAREKNKRISEIAKLPQDMQRTNDMLWNFIYSIWDGIQEALNVLCKYLYYPHLNVYFDDEQTKAINNAMKNAPDIESRKAYGKQIVDLAHAIYPGYADDSSRLWEISREVEKVATKENRWFQKQDQSQSQSRGY